MEVDFLIIGQGLAGTLLAFDLLDRGKKVLIVSDPSLPCASHIAAGLYNPVTGNKLVKTWKADVLFVELETYYRKLENLLEAKFLHATGIYRPFASMEEQNDWMAKSADPSFSSFVNKVVSHSHSSGLIHDPFGGVYLKTAGFVNTHIFLNAAKKYFKAKGCLVEELFLEDNLSLLGRGISYKKVSAGGIVLANGLGTTLGSLFSWLPFHPLKGEILEVSTNLQEEMVFNRGCFMLPTENGLWKVGSTYNWRQPDYEPSAQGKNELLEKLNHLFKSDVEVVAHKAGIRPSTVDRRPLVGRHPKHRQVIIFNGLGTKGVSLGPYFASELGAHLVNQCPLSKEVDIERYFSLYFERIAE